MRRFLLVFVVLLVAAVYCGQAYCQDMRAKTEDGRARLS